MNAAAIAHLVVAMLLPEFAAQGAKVNWRGVESKFDQALQRAIPLHWVEGPLQKAGDLVLEAAAKTAAHPAEVQAILQALNGGDVTSAETQFVALLVTVEPELKLLLAAAA